MIEGLVNSLEGYLKAGSPVVYAAAYLGGVMTSFTPCVYPVIPITVGFIGAKSRGSRGRGFALSVSYVVGMAITYAALGTAAALSGKVFGSIAASPIPYFIVGALCLVLAASMFDAIHIPVPSFLSRAGSSGKPGGAIGALTVGMASGLVVAPCTVPVLGALLLFVASRQNTALGMSLLFLFALGMGSLLIVLGTFSGLLAGLPKSGRWMERVKQGLGLLLALSGAYFLLQAGRLIY